MENSIRLGVALAVFLLMIGWEVISPRRISVTRGRRWPVNLGLAFFNMALMRATVGGLAYLSALDAAERSFGLLHLFAVPDWLAVVMTLLALDAAIYMQHVLTHKWPLLWRLHQVHHSDLEFDATTAVRFHPLEIVLSMLYKVGCVYLLGAEPTAVVAFEMILNGAATFNHSNIRIPLWLDRALRVLLITPDMHRIHHSTLRHETDSNYGFSVSLWDRMFRTYTAAPEQPQTRMKIGLPSLRESRELSFLKLLALPFRRLR